MWITMSNFPYIDLGMMVPEQPSLKQSRKICTGLWKGPEPVLLWAWRHICVFFTGRKWSFMSFWLVWCVQKKNTCPDDKVAAEAFPEELKWECWTCLPDALTSSCLLRKGRSQWWWLVIPSFLENLLHKFPELSESYLLWSQPKNAEWMSGRESVPYLGMQMLTLPLWCSICCWNEGPENWDLRNFPYGLKETC